MGDPSTAWQVVDWRRRVTELYAAVRSSPEPAKAHALWVRERDLLLKTHPASPVAEASRARYPGQVVAPYDPSFRFEVDVETDIDPETREVATGTDGVVVFERCGRVRLADLGSLDLWWLTGYGGGVFLPVRDRAATSYGGGRYLLDTVKGADLGGNSGRLVIDLNFAYQPSCAYDEAWACPLAGPTNTLDVEVPVGEHYAAITS